MATGELHLSNVTDEQFEKLIQIKDKTDGALSMPSSQPVSPTTIDVGGKKISGFTGIYLNFKDAKGLKAAAEILEMLAT